MDNLILKKYDKLIYKILLGLVFALAIFFRVKAYLLNPSFWCDESALALNVVGRNFAQLMFGPLTNAQSAPPIFIVLTKLLVNILGDIEIVYRFMPFMFGILSIPLFYFVSQKFLTNKWVILFANVLFAINFNIIAYSSMFKHYSFECFLFLLSVMLLDRIDFLNRKQFVVLALIFAVAPWFSLPLLFLIAAFDIAVLIFKKMNFKSVVLINIPCLISTILYYIFVLWQEKVEMDYFYGDYWSDKFYTLSLDGIVLLKDNLDFLFYPNTKFILFSIVLLVGWIYFVKDKKFLNICVFLVLVLCTLVSFIKVYPLFQRTFMFFMPLCLISFVYPLEKIKRGWFVAIATVVLILSLHSYNLGYFKNLYNCSLYDHFDFRNTFNSLSSKLKKDDKCYFYATNVYDILYYSRKLGNSNKLYRFTLSDDKAESMKKLDDMVKSTKGDLYIYIEFFNAKIIDKNPIIDWLNTHEHEVLGDLKFVDKRDFWLSSKDKLSIRTSGKNIRIIKIVK